MIFKNGDKIVFAGDSVTDNGRKRPIGEGLWEGVGNGYVRRIDDFMNVAYPEMILHIINQGTSGNTSRDLAARFDSDVIALKPDYVYIMIGVNDIWRQFDEPSCPDNHVLLPEYKQNVSEMIDKCLAAGITPACITPYFMELNKNDLMRKRVDEYRLAMTEICAEKNVKCIDVQKAFDKYLKFRHPAYIMWDRVHPGNIGSMIIAREFLRAVGFDRKFF